MAGRGGPSDLVGWAAAASRKGGEEEPPLKRAKYSVVFGKSGAPAPIRAVVVSHLRADLSGSSASLDARLDDIAQMVCARVSASSWCSYSSHITQFVRFCDAEDLPYLPATQLTGVMWAQHLAAKGTVRASTAQPYFSAINTLHELLSYPKPCGADNPLLANFCKGWERLQVSLEPAKTLVLAFAADMVWQLYLQLPSVSGSPLTELLFVVLGFLTFLRPASLLSVDWWCIASHAGSEVFQYRPVTWKGKVVQPSEAPVLQLPLVGVPLLRGALLAHGHMKDPLWSRTISTPTAEGWFNNVLRRHSLAHLADMHTLYSLRRGGASAARAAGVPLEVVESFGGWCAGSRALKEHYLDMGITSSVAGTAFFGALASRQVAPFAVQYFNR